MAVDSIGSVSVDIRGDYSRLQADFAGAQALAAKAGAGIASSLTTGMAPAAAQAGVVLDKFGVAFKSVAAGATAATPPVLNLNAGIQRLIIAQEMLRVAYGQTNPVIKEQNAELGHSVTQIQATSGALRVFEGHSGIRAAERFLTMIPGIGTALQAAFPIIGALALFEMISRMIPKVGELTEAQKALAEATKQNDAEWERFANQLERTNIQRLTEQFGKAKGLHLQQFYDDATAQRDVINLQNAGREVENAQRLLAEGIKARNELLETPTNPVSIGRFIGTDSVKDLTANLQKAQDKYATLEAANRDFETQRRKLAEDIPRAQQEQAGQQGAANINARIQAGEHLAAQQKAWTDEQIKEDHYQQQLRILGITDTGTRAVAEAAEELRVAQATQAAITADHRANVEKRITDIRAEGAARAMGKSAPEQKLIRTETETKVGDYQAQIDKQTIDASDAVSAERRKLGLANVTAERGWAEQVTREWEKSYETRRKDAAHTFEEENIGAARVLLAAQAAAEIQAKSKGDIDALNTLKQKIQLEGAYANQLSHSKAQEIQYARDLAALDSKARQDRIAGEEKKLAPMVAELPAATDPTYEAKYKAIKELEAQIAELRAKANNDDLAALNTIDALVRKLSEDWQLGHEIKQTLEDWKAIGVKRAELQTVQAALQVPAALGGAVAGGLFNSGKQGMDIGRQIGDAMKNIGKQLAGELIADAIKKLLAQMLLSTAAQTILTAVLGANTVATSTSAGVTVLNTGATAANTIALLWHDIASLFHRAIGRGPLPPLGSTTTDDTKTAAQMNAPILNELHILEADLGRIQNQLASNESQDVTRDTAWSTKELALLSQIAACSCACEGAKSGGPKVGGGGGSTSSKGAADGVPGGGPGNSRNSGYTWDPNATDSGAQGTSDSTITYGDIVSGEGTGGGSGGGSGGDDSTPAPREYALGGRAPAGVPGIFGHGPEMWIPDQAGTVIPAGKWGGMAPALPSISGVSSSSSQSIGELHVHAHGITNPKEFVRQVARELPGYLKSTGPGYSPASR